MKKKSLCVLNLTNPSDEIRGKLRRYFYEIDANTFVGTVSSKVRTTLWDILEDNAVKATFIYSSSNEQGFEVKSTDNNRYGFVELDGVSMPYKKRKSIPELYAKPDKKLLDHILEAGYMAECIMRYGRLKTTIEYFSEQFEIGKDELISSIAFLCALHDIGKAHPGFFKKMAEKYPEELSDLLNEMMDNGMICEEDDMYPEDIRHERYSYEILKNYFIEHGFKKSSAENFALITAFHHQGRSGGFSVFKHCPDDERWNEWKAAQDAIISEVEKHWTFSPKMQEIRSGINGFSYLILACMITCDWIVSGKKWNELGQFDKSGAKAFLDANMMSYQPMSESLRDVTWEKAFHYQMNDMQKKICEVITGYTDLVLIEAPCGLGKSAAALLCMVLCAAIKSGPYFALPTTSTANSMVKTIRNIVKELGLNIQIPEFDSSAIWNDDEMSKIDPELWVSRSRHKFLYPAACGTIDQMLKIIRTYRYGAIGMLGLADKVVIIDEIHSYDAYMLTEIKELIRWCKFLHVPVIMLSATLSSKTKRELFKAAGVDNAELKKAYPLISVIKDGMLEQHTFACEGRIMPFSCKRVDNINNMLYLYGKELKKGCMALIAPTVDDAFDIYYRLRETVTDCEVVLYHGRDTIEHKDGKISKLTKLLGKDGKREGKRPDKLIVVATSIIEQSLDVDFDYMITALAPVDLLIQRLGRVWRHDDKGTIREHENIENAFIVLIPDQYDSLSRIYNVNVLDHTVDAIKSIENIHTVNDVRDLIDRVYENAVIMDESLQKIRSGALNLGNPFKSCTNIIDKNNYLSFDPIETTTRETSYETVDIAILPEIKDSYTADEIRDIRRKYVVNVAEYRVRCFPDYLERDELSNVRIYVSKDQTVRNGKKFMTLTNDGLYCA